MLVEVAPGGGRARVVERLGSPWDVRALLHGAGGRGRRRAAVPGRRGGRGARSAARSGAAHRRPPRPARPRRLHRRPRHGEGPRRRDHRGADRRRSARARPHRRRDRGGRRGFGARPRGDRTRLLVVPARPRRPDAAAGAVRRPLQPRARPAARCRHGRDPVRRRAACPGGPSFYRAQIVSRRRFAYADVERILAGADDAARRAAARRATDRRRAARAPRTARGALQIVSRELEITLDDEPRRRRADDRRAGRARARRGADDPRQRGRRRAARPPQGAGAVPRPRAARPGRRGAALRRSWPTSTCRRRRCPRCSRRPTPRPPSAAHPTPSRAMRPPSDAARRRGRR